MGGKNILPMKALRDLLEGLGYQNIKTYIQSGNCILESETGNATDLASNITVTIEGQFGFRAAVMVIEKDSFAACIQENPYIVEEDKLNTVHLFFLAQPATTPDIDKMEKVCAETEAYKLTDKVIYLHAPNGIGRSKFATQAERCLGVKVTARNLRSAMKILSLADQG